MTVAGLIRARCDAADRLVEADEILAALQVRMGGGYPGALALPGLLSLVRRARMSRVALTGHVTVADEGQPVTFSVRVVPEADGTRMEVSEWKVAAEAWQRDSAAGVDEALLRRLAEAHVVLDAEQRVVSGMVTASDLSEFEAALRQGFGRYWTDLVVLEGNSHRQPLHWRLLDDASLSIPGSSRDWKARLMPLRGGGFELLLVAETVLPSSAPAIAAVPDGDGGAQSPEWKGLLGNRLAPALRLPVNRIIANAETIRTRLAGPLAEQYVGYAGDIADAGRHLLSLVEDIADLEAVEDEAFASATDQVDLADCARRAAGILGVRARERGISLHLTTFDGGVPALGEFRRVLQILLNLVGNAIRYSPEGTEVRIEGGSDGAVAWVSVADQGAGIAPDQAEKVFEKFERLGRSGDGGSGLGLYISRRLARAMGGDLVVLAGKHGAGQGGAHFLLTLPADHAAQASAAG